MLNKKLSLQTDNTTRKKPYNLDIKDENLFSKEFSKKLPAVYPYIKKKSLIMNCGKLFNGFVVNSLQFNISLSLKALIKSYLKSLLFLVKARNLTRIDIILYVTNSNSKNFFHWSLDVLQKLEFLDQRNNQFLNTSSYFGKFIWILSVFCVNIK